MEWLKVYQQDCLPKYCLVCACRILLKPVLALYLSSTSTLEIWSSWHPMSYILMSLRHILTNFHQEMLSNPPNICSTRSSCRGAKKTFFHGSTRREDMKTKRKPEGIVYRHCYVHAPQYVCFWMLYHCIILNVHNMFGSFCFWIDKTLFIYGN